MSVRLPRPGPLGGGVAAPPRVLASPRRPPDHRGDRGRGGLAVAALTALTVASFALFLLPLGVPPGSRVDLDEMTGYGLVSVLPTASLAGVAALTLTFLATLTLRQPARILLGVQLVALVVCLHGIAGLVEPLPRFATAWQHAGFVEYIARTGDTLPALDARFNWPGFFALAAFWASFLTGFVPGASPEDLIPVLVPVLRVAPVAFHLCYLVAFLLLLRRLRAHWRARCLAAWLLVSANWVGQDYFSPQAQGFLLYLLFLAVLLAHFQTAGHDEEAGAKLPRLVPHRLLRARRRPPRPGELPGTAEPARRPAVLVLLFALFLVATASHQLTPILLAATVGGLVLAGRCPLPALPLTLILIVAGWVNLMAMPYWSGHLDTIVGDIGDLGGNVSTSVAGRMDGDPQHLAVQYLRLLVAGAVFGFAAVGVLRRRRRGYRDRTAVVLALAPFVALALQSYGGEIALRVYLFALPGACALAAFAFFPAPGPPRWRTTCAAALCALLVVGGFYAARYGNERYERVRPGEVAAMEYVYRHDAGGARVVWLTPVPDGDFTPNMPWGFRDVERVEYVSARAPHDPTQVGDLVAELRAYGPGTYLITTRGQEAYFEVRHGFPPDWGERFRARMAEADSVSVATANQDAALYVVEGSRGDAAPVAGSPGTWRGADGPVVGDTPLTPFALLIVPLVVVLAARDLLRLRLPVSERYRLRPLTVTAALLLAFVAAVMLERTLLLG